MVTIKDDIIMFKNDVILIYISKSLYNNLHNSFNINIIITIILLITI